MQNKRLMPWGCLIALAALFLTAGAGVTTAQQKKQAQLGSPDTRDTRRMEALKEQVRHQLVMLPYYSVFDWLQAGVKPDGTVVLKGEVTRPTLKNDAEHRVKNIEAATRVINNIEVLPLSTFDDELRVALYRSLFRYNSPLFRYGTQSVPPIHIIVKNGRVALEGAVNNENDKTVAGLKAKGISGVFDVKNNLRVER